VSAAAAAAQPPAAGKPLSPAAVFEWTTTLLEAEAGLLVPDSEYDAREQTGDPLSDPRIAGRLVLGQRLRALDRVQAGVELLERAGFRRGRRRAAAG
jgi:hypothetical protein